MNALFYSIYAKPLPWYLYALLWICMSCVVIICAYMAWSNPEHPLYAIRVLARLVFSSPFVTYAMLGFFLITFLFLQGENEKRLFGMSVLLSITGFIFYNFVLGKGTGLVSMEKMFKLLFLFTLGFLIWKMVFGDPQHRGYYLRYGIEYLVLPLQAILSIYFSGALKDNLVNFGVAQGLLYANRETLDYLLYAYDASLKIPIYTAFTWWGAQPWTHIPIAQSYACLIGLVMFSQYLQRRNPGKSPAEIVLTFTLAGLLGMILYRTIPGCGMRCLFGPDFPYNMPPGGGKYMPVHSDIPTNAMPSLHFTWALLLLFHSAFFGVRYIALYSIYAVLIIIGVLGSGEHHFIDLIVAFPFALFVQAACTQSWSEELHKLRLLTMIISGLMIAAWFLFLIYGLSIYSGNTLLCRTLDILTVAITGWFAFRLYRATP